MTPKYSIVIPTYNHCDDLLKPCIESIKQYTELNSVEVIVVANGCTDGTRQYVEQLGHPFKLIWSNEPLGYTKATNLGIMASSGEYVVLLNNDTELLPQSTNLWLNMMEQKFTDSVGMVGPLMLHDDYSNHDVLIFFCVMIKREVFDKIGLLDEIYSPGGGEDIDFSIRMKNAGYQIAAVSDVEYMPHISTNSGSVPIWHKDNKTFGEIPQYTNEIVKTNGLLNCKRYNKNIRLNLGAGGVDYSGHLSVDLYDKRAHIHMDITKLDFDDNTVEEILASHVFEHLNPYHSIDILKNWLRVLKPGGKLVMEMPNIEELCKRFVTASTGERYGILNAIYGSVNTTNEGGPDNITSPHLFGWWPQSTIDHLSNAGLVNIQIMNEQIPHPESNFRVEAYKPSNKRSLEWLKTDKESAELYSGIVEQNEYGVTEELLRNKTVIDVGANRGIFSILSASLGASQVFSYEPVSETFNILKDNINKSGYDNIQPIQKIVNNETGNFVRISLNDESGHNSIYTQAFKNGNQRFEEIETISLRDAITSLSGNIFLKLDCEGSEYDIILSMTEEDARKIDVISLEIHEEMHPTYRGSEVISSKLKELGYNQQFSHRTGWWTFNDKGEKTTFDPLPFKIEMWTK